MNPVFLHITPSNILVLFFGVMAAGFVWAVIEIYQEFKLRKSYDGWDHTKEDGP